MEEVNTAQDLVRFRSGGKPFTVRGEVVAPGAEFDTGERGGREITGTFAGLAIGKPGKDSALMVNAGDGPYRVYVPFTVVSRG